MIEAEYIRTFIEFLAIISITIACGVMIARILDNRNKRRVFNEQAQLPLTSIQDMDYFDRVKFFELFVESEIQKHYWYNQEINWESIIALAIAINVRQG